MDYIAALLNGYEDPPKGVELQPGQYRNKYMPGHLIAMPPPINPGQVGIQRVRTDGRPVPETVAQYSYDVTAFMMWLGRAEARERKRTGLFMMPLLIVLALLLYSRRSASGAVCLAFARLIAGNAWDKPRSGGLFR